MTEPQNPATPLSRGGTGEGPDAGHASGEGDNTARWCAQLREQWLNGQRVCVEDFLQRVPQTQGNEEALLDLIYTEYVLRDERGESPGVQEYVQRFPHLQGKLERILELDKALWEHADDVTKLAGETTPSPAVPPEAPQRIGKYHVIGTLGQGGQASVYRAVHPHLGKEVVIKVAHAPGRQAAGGPEPLDRSSLLREGQLLCELEHPHLGRVYDLDFFAGEPFLVMEYVRGRSLEQYSRQHRFTPHEVAGLVAKLARGLAVAHRRGIIHRDIKPRNIVMDEQSEPHLIDFGLARLEDAWTPHVEPAGLIQGTVAYMSPEQARGQSQLIGPASDLFALGGVLFFLLTGQHPYDEPDLTRALRKVQACDWNRAALADAAAPRRLAAICRRLLSEKPDDRYPSAEILAQELERVARQPRRRRNTILTLAMLALAAVGGLVVLAVLGTKEPAAPPLNFQHPALSVKVKEKKRSLSVIEVGSLRTKDLVNIRVQAPAGAYLALVWWSSDGKLELLSQQGPQPASYAFFYPPGENETLRLTGKPGTEFVLVCGRRSGPVTLDDIQKAWADAAPWPVLPPQALLRLQTDRVVVEQKGRAVVLEKGEIDPEEAVVRRLEGLRLQLVGQFEFFEGLAFCHEG